MRIAFLNWRDLTHPEGGGAERYAETVCAGLAARGHDVTFFCAAHGDALPEEWVQGFRMLRRGGRASVYPRALRALRREAAAGGPFDVVVDTQNGIAFGAPLATRTPIVSLVHHVHREQWPVVFGPGVARAGWFLESRVSPRLYRGRQYVAVSGRTRDELADLGVNSGAVTVIHNGTDRPMALTTARSTYPSIVVLGRLVPHKRVELAIDVLARLREAHPGVQLRVIGDGWWHDEIADHADRLGVADAVHLLGFVDEETKHRELASAWVALAPSAKEGWGLNVVEAASHGVPTIAHHRAGGLSESILDGQTGLLVDDLDGLAGATSLLLSNLGLRDELGRNARVHAARFTWEGTIGSWEDLLRHVVAGGDPVAETDRQVQPTWTDPAPLSPPVR